jgi:hypothetical protein
MCPAVAQEGCATPGRSATEGEEGALAWMVAELFFTRLMLLNMEHVSTAGAASCAATPLCEECY